MDVCDPGGDVVLPALHTGEDFPRVVPSCSRDSALQPSRVLGETGGIIRLNAVKDPIVGAGVWGLAGQAEPHTNIKTILKQLTSNWISPNFFFFSSFAQHMFRHTHEHLLYSPSHLLPLFHPPYIYFLLYFVYRVYRVHSSNFSVILKTSHRELWPTAELVVRLTDHMQPTAPSSSLSFSFFPSLSPSPIFLSLSLSLKPHHQPTPTLAGPGFPLGARLAQRRIRPQHCSADQPSYLRRLSAARRGNYWSGICSYV